MSPCRPRSSWAPPTWSPPGAGPPASRARAAGADAVVRLDEPGDLAGRLRAASGGDGPTLVVDPLWGEPAAAALEAAAPGARVLQLGQSAGPVAAVSSGAVRGKALDILGYTNLRVPFDVLAAGYRTLVEHARGGRIAVDVERVPLGGAVEAWVRQAAGAATKLVITFDGR